jgi:ABC-type nitrate/sulfonate/bicarbonate transport system permease component
MRALRKSVDLLPGLAFIAAAILALQQLVEVGVINRALFPPPSVIAVTVWDLLANGDVAGPLGATLSLFAIGYVLAAIIGIALGLVMGSSQTVTYLLDPLFESIRPLPKAALVPVLMLFLGLGTTMKVTSIVLASFFPILINTIQGVRGVDPVLVATGRVILAIVGLAINAVMAVAERRLVPWLEKYRVN